MNAKEIITVGDLVKYLTENFAPDKPILKSDLAKKGYNRFRTDVQSTYMVRVNTDPDLDCDFVDAKKTGVGSVEVMTAVVL